MRAESPLKEGNAITPAELAALRERGETHALLDVRERGRKAMEDYLRWEELLDDKALSPHPLLENAR